MEKPAQFSYDVFLSHSSKDKAVVKALAERLKKDGLKVWFEDWEIPPGDSISLRERARVRAAKIEEGLERSRVLVLCMSVNAFGSDWAQLEASTFRFRDPLNKERRFIPLRLDDAPIKGSLAQFLYINWRPVEREQEYAKLLEACRPPAKPKVVRKKAEHKQIAEKAIQLQLDSRTTIHSYAFSLYGKRALTGGDDNTVRLWDLDTRRCLCTLKGHKSEVWSVTWSTDERRAISGSDDNTVRLWDMKTGRCLRVLDHTDSVKNVAWSTDERRAISGSDDNTIRLWDIETGLCLYVLEGHTETVWSLAWSADDRRVLSGSGDNTVRLWDIETGQCLRVLEGHTEWVTGVTWSADQNRAISGSYDRTLRLWNLETGRCLRVFQGHTGYINCVALSGNQRYLLSGSDTDKTVRLWEVESGYCLRVLEGHTGEIDTVAWSADGHHAFSGDSKGNIRMWDLSESIVEARAFKVTVPALPTAPDQVQYTNAKVLLVGDTSSGKTGLAHRLATGKWRPSDGSTVGAWSTQWKLNDPGAEPGMEREIWLWDFGGQADQRLIHQLYMDRSALILLLFNADQEDVLPGLRDWQTALRRCVPADTPQLLVAGRIDAGFKASRGKLQSFAREHHLKYIETSSREGTGCEELQAAILSGIPWANIPITTTEHLFKLIKDEILKLRDKGQVLHTFKELRELLWRSLSKEPRFTDETLHTVIGLLDGPGVVKELDFGTYILLQPEWVNVYAQAVIRTLRSDERELGCLPLRSITEGELVYQSVGQDGNLVEIKRLPQQDERIVLREMERQLLERGLCLRQGDKLVFPSHCGRDRPKVVEHPSVFVSYTVKGYLDDIYATLVVKLADSESFTLKELWRDAADFDTLEGGHRMGVKLTRESAGSGEISVYFGPGVTQEQQVIFANYIHAHLKSGSEQVQRLRYYVCPECNTPKGNPQVLMEKLLDKKQEADTECDKCGERFGLWDALEKKFASKKVHEQVEGLQAEDVIRLDSRRKGKLLTLEVGARITSADQKCFEIPATEDEGLDMELEFTDDEGKGTGNRLYLQLKAGNSYLRMRKKDGVEIFTIKKQGWVKNWLKQPHPVMLVIGTFSKDQERLAVKDKLEFAEVRWMEISSYLKRESQGGTKPVKQIEFKGERLDMTSVRKWRGWALGGHESI
jgi:WD40 repeat protein